MEKMEEGKKNNPECVDDIICHEELQPEVHQLHDQNSEVIGDISTIQDSKEALCLDILLETLEKIVNQPSDPDSEDLINPNDDDKILQMNIREIIPGQIPLMQENIVQDIVKNKSSTLTSQTPQKMTQKVKGKYSK